MLSEIQLYKLLKNKNIPEPLAVFKILNHNITEKGIKFTAQISNEIEILFVRDK